jgi:hypothetical protein
VICKAVADSSDNQEYERQGRHPPASDNRSRTGTAWKATDGSRTPADEFPRKSLVNRCRKTGSHENIHRPDLLTVVKVFAGGKISDGGLERSDSDSRAAQAARILVSPANVSLTRAAAVA